MLGLGSGLGVQVILCLLLGSVEIESFALEVLRVKGLGFDVGLGLQGLGVQDLQLKKFQFQGLGFKGVGASDLGM